MSVSAASRYWDAALRPFSMTMSQVFDSAEPAMIMDREPTVAKPAFGRSLLSPWRSSIAS